MKHGEGRKGRTERNQRRGKILKKEAGRETKIVCDNNEEKMQRLDTLIILTRGETSPLSRVIDVDVSDDSIRSDGV